MSNNLSIHQSTPDSLTLTRTKVLVESLCFWSYLSLANHHQTLRQSCAASYRLPLAARLIFLCLISLAVSVTRAQSSTEFSVAGDSHDSVAIAIRQLDHPAYSIRYEQTQHLQRLGWEAADQLIAARSASTGLEQQQSIDRLLQQLPSLHSVITSLDPACPQEIAQRMRNFQTLPFSNKAAVVRFLEQQSEATSRRLALYTIARFDSDSLVRDFATVTLLDDLFPIHDVKAYSTHPSPLLLQIPDRSDPKPHSSETSKIARATATPPTWLDWVLGKAELKCVSLQEYQLVFDEASTDSLTSQARLLGACLRQSHSDVGILTHATLRQIVASTDEAVAFPISAASPQRFDLHYEVLVRTARWGLIQSRHVPEFDEDFRRLVDNLQCLGNDPDCFRPNADVFCEVAVIMQQPDWLIQWRDGCQNNSVVSHPTSTLSLSEAAFQLNCRQQAESWLEADLLGGRSRFSALQYAVLGKELGHSDCYRYLLRRVASQPINGNPAAVTARLLNAESFAEDCDYENASQQLSWLLNTLHRDRALAVKMEKRLPNGLNEVRVRYHYFRAQDAADHWDWSAAIAHLSIGHSLDPTNTNILTLAWKLEPHLQDGNSKIVWEPVAERLEFVQRQSIQGHWTTRSGTVAMERHSDFPLPQSLSPGAYNHWGNASLVPTMLGVHQEAVAIELPALRGLYLKKQTEVALEYFESKIHLHRFQLDGGGKPAAEQLAIRKLSSNLNRWAYLADASQNDSELAYNRAKQATQLVGNSAAYFDTLARCCQNSGRLDEAIDATRTAMALAPHDPNIRTRLATLQTFAQSDLR